MVFPTACKYIWNCLADRQPGNLLVTNRQAEEQNELLIFFYNIIINQV